MTAADQVIAILDRERKIGQQEGLETAARMATEAAEVYARKPAPSELPRTRENRAHAAVLRILAREIRRIADEGAL